MSKDCAGLGALPSLSLLEPFRPAEAARAQRPHVLVCVSGHGLDLELIRQGRVLAGLLDARLTVLHAFCLGEGEAERQALTRDRSHAVARGAVFVELPAYSPADGIVEYVQTRGVTHLVLADGGSGPWYAAWRDALPQQLVKRLAGVDLYFVAEPATRTRHASPPQNAGS